MKDGFQITILHFLAFKEVLNGMGKIKISCIPYCSETFRYSRI